MISNTRFEAVCDTVQNKINSTKQKSVNNSKNNTKNLISIACKIVGEKYNLSKEEVYFKLTNKDLNAWK